jgi:probable F420-dependent oxidoreductase
MTERAFRFGVVVGQARDGVAWLATARRAEELGYDILLIPDTVHTLAPFPALSAAAAATRTLRVGTYVLSAPNRTPGLVAWESSCLQLLSGGRFELGLGAGRPGADRDADVLGGEFGTPGSRLRRVAATIEAVTQEDDRPPILVAASRPRMLRLAAEQADTVALGLPPGATENELACTIATLRTLAGRRFDDLELHVNVAGLAERPEDLPSWLSRMVHGDPQAMATAGGIGFLLGTSDEVADTLLRRRKELGVSYVAVNGLFMEQFAPVVARLRDA